MTISAPKIHLLYFKTLIDVCFIRFFDDFNSSFKNINCQYIFSNDPGKARLKKIFKQYIIDELKTLIVPYSILSPNYFLILGACTPKNNILLKNQSQSKYFPEKLTKLINSDFELKYILKEKDIKLDLIYFNSIFSDIFNDFFSANEKKIIKLFGEKHNNIIFIQHKQLDCYSLFKIIKFIFGKNNCNNIFIQKYLTLKSPIVAINDLIDKYIINKIQISKSAEFKTIIAEVQQFVNERIIGINNGN